MVCVLCGVVQRVMGNVCVHCVDVAAYNNYDVCTLWWCGSVLFVWCVYCVFLSQCVIDMRCVDLVMWQHVIFMVFLLCCVVAYFTVIVCVLYVCVAAC